MSEDFENLSIKRHVNIPKPIDNFIVKKALESGFTYTHVLCQMLEDSRQRLIIQEELIRKEFGLK